MVLKMKNINFWGVHWKSQLLGGGRNIEGGDCLKRRVGLFADLRGGLRKKIGVMFLREGRDPNAHYVNGRRFLSRCVILVFVKILQNIWILQVISLSNLVFSLD